MDDTGTQRPQIGCLLVEADEDYACLIRACLEGVPQIACRLHREPDFDAALASLQDDGIGVCFVGHRLGARSGIDFIEAASRSGASVPLILLTRRAEPEVDSQACMAGAADVVPERDLSTATLSRAIRFAHAHGEQNKALLSRQAELKEAMRVLAEQRTLLKLAIDNTKHGIAMFDAGKRLVACNARYLEIYGFSPDVVQPGVSIDEILRYSISLGNYTDEEAERILAERQLQVSSQRPSTYRQCLKDGRTIVVDHKPIAGDRSVTTCEDITEALLREQRSAELARKAALADAERTAKAKFLSNMSHELRTPLNAIIGFTDTMRQELFGPLGEQYQAYAGDIFDSASSLLTTVDQLLDMSLLYGEELNIEEEVFGLADIVRATLRKHGAAAAEKHIAVNLALGDSPLRVRADSAKIAQAIDNVVDNAVKFSLPHAAIDVSLALGAGGEAVVTVTDAGGGIPEDCLGAVLTPFEQQERADARRHHGAGLGLPIAEGLIRLHGGDIALESEVGVGTTVTIRLPAERVVQPSADRQSGTAA